MPKARIANPGPPTPGRVSLSAGLIVIRDDDAFGPEAGESCARFLARAFAVAEVRSVSVDRVARAASIRHDAGRSGLPGLLEALAAALRGGVDPARAILLPAFGSASKFSLHRHGATLTTWEVVLDLPGRLKLRQEALKGDPVVVNHVVRELLKVPGVHRVRPSESTGHLLIRYDPSSIAARALLGRAESTLLEHQARSTASPGGILTRFGLANFSLGVAVIGETLVPALLPASAILLVATNASTLRLAIRLLGERRLGLPVLYIAIVATTLLTGQFLASALMTWLFRFWHRRFRVELATERDRLLDRSETGPLMARLLVPSGAEVLVPAGRLKAGDRLLVSKGEKVPCDGPIIEGEGVVDERAIRGVAGISAKRIGDTLLAGSQVLAGSFEVEVAMLGERTRAASIRRALISATSPTFGQSAPTDRSERFASRAVGPTLATAGVGLLAGDLMTVGAILRPDYATGPGLAVPLETLHKVALCARAGIIARHPEALERLAEVELFVLQDHPSLRKPSLEVSKIETRLPEDLLLRYASSAFRHLVDDRSTALVEASRRRHVHLLDLPPVEFGQGVTITHGSHRIRVGETNADAGSPLTVEIDGTVVGLIQFESGDRLESASAIDRVRRTSHIPFALVSPRGADEVAGLAKSLGVEMFRGDFKAGDTAEFLQACKARGLKAAFVGDARAHPEAARRAHVVISLADDHDLDLDLDSAAFLFQQAGLAPLADLGRIGRDHANRVVQAQQLILLPNLLCVAGAFLFGFTGMTAVMLSNLGTLGLYRLASDSLRGLDPPSNGRTGQPRRAG